MVFPRFQDELTPTLENSEVSRYIRTTLTLSAKTTLQFDNLGVVRFFSADEADKLDMRVRRRNVFARHSGENIFYLERIRHLANHTVIEICLPGDPVDIADEAEAIASILEKLTLLSSALVLKRSDFQRRLGINSRLGAETDFTIGPGFRFVRSRARPAIQAQGIVLDDAFCRRFRRNNFVMLAGYIQSNGDIAARVRSSLDWLFDARIEPRLPAATVKTSIAVESLLVFSETESLAQSISERAAFILSSDPSRRQLVSRIFKRFYEARSGVVHGSKSKVKKLTPQLLETVDRLVIMMQLTIAANSNLWSTTENLRLWCEGQRWGQPSNEVIVPFQDVYLRNALVAGEKEFPSST